MKRRMHEEVAKTLHSLDHIKNASAPEGFYTRLMERMELQQDNPKQQKVIQMLKIGIAAAITMTILNLSLTLYENQAELDLNDFSEAYFESPSQTFAYYE